MTDTTTNPRLFSRDPAERRAFREELGAGIGRFIPPELRSRFQFLAEMTPSAAVERAGQASQRVFDADRTAMDRVGDFGTMLSETAGVAAPFAVATRAAMPAAEAAQEALLGFSVPARAAAETAFERLNQPGPMPEVLYSNPPFDPMAQIRALGLARDNLRRAESPNPDLVPRTADPDVALSDFAQARERMMGASNDLSFGELQGLIDAQAAARRGVVAALSDAPTVRLFDRNDRAVVVGPGMGPGEDGRFRVTYFDADREPTNHTVFETKDEALNAALREGFVSRSAARGPSGSEPENFAQGGAVMMRSGMPEQIHQGLGSLSEVARRMFMGGEVSGHPLDQYGQYLTQTYAAPIQQSASQAVSQFVDSVRQKERDYFGGGGMGAGMGGGMGSPLQGGLMGSPTDAGSTLAVGGLSAPMGQVGILTQNPSQVAMQLGTFDAQVAAAKNTPPPPSFMIGQKLANEPPSRGFDPSMFQQPMSLSFGVMEGFAPPVNDGFAERRAMNQGPMSTARYMQDAALYDQSLRGPSPFGNNVNPHSPGMSRGDFFAPPSTDSAHGRLSAANATAAFAGMGIDQFTPFSGAPMDPRSYSVDAEALRSGSVFAPEHRRLV